jgi:ABC-type uncharacterized transport system auxiliary subunit
LGRQRKNNNLTVNKKNRNMKKTIAIVTLAVTLASCGGSTSTETTTTDSTKVTVDSTKAVDSTIVDTVKEAK